MNVNSVDSGKIAITKKGNEYKKSNNWLIYGASLSFLDIGTAQLLKAKGNMKDSFKSIQELPKPARLGLFLVQIGLWFGAGRLIDNIINKTRAKKADKEAASI